MGNKQFYIERNDDGDYRGKEGGAKRSSTVQPTQKEAIDAIREMHPGAAIHVERVRETNLGGRDKWRKP